MTRHSVEQRTIQKVSGAEELLQRFRQRFGGPARLFRAPGRVNLIGEHTDYNDGFVMPAAIGLSCWVAASMRNDRKLVVHAEEFGETVEADLAAAAPTPSGRWSAYVLGVAAMLERAGIPPAGGHLLIHSEVPMGGGLGSSAAIEVATACALTTLAGQVVEPARLARVCQQAEHEYAGVRCGIMDQFAALHGATGHAFLLDCRSLEYTLLPLPEGVRLATCHTMVKHELAGSEYNQRRADCEEAVARLSASLPGIRALRDVSVAQLEKHRQLLPERVYRRARHVVTENTRTQHAAAALREGNLARLGVLMADSHASLRDDYEVSCKELDLMVEIAGRQRGIHGSRMTGAGFGGCTVSLVDAQHAEEFRESVAAEYERATGTRPRISILTAAPAAGEVALS